MAPAKTSSCLVLVCVLLAAAVCSCWATRPSQLAMQVPGAPLAPPASPETSPEAVPAGPPAAPWTSEVLMTAPVAAPVILPAPSSETLPAPAELAPSPEAISVPPPAQQPPPPSPNPAAPPPGPAVQLKQCVLLPNTNARGTSLKEQGGTASATECCTACQQTEDCNVFVFCPKNGGCDDGSGKIYSQGVCTLKTQQLAPGAQPAYYATGPVVSWSSGYISS